MAILEDQRDLLAGQVLDLGAGVLGQLERHAASVTAVRLAGVPAPGGPHSHPVTGEVPELPVRHDVSMDKSLSSYLLPYPTCRLPLEGGVP